MKAALAFLFVALSCSFGSGNTMLTAPGGYKKNAADVPTIPKDCIEKLLKVDVPETLTKLQELLCMYMQGKKEKNEELFKAFLKQLHETLKDAGCTVDEILSTEEFLEKIADKVGEAADKLVFEILKTAEGLNVLGPVLTIACGLLGDTIKTLAESLAGLDLKGLTGGLPILG